MGVAWLSKSAKPEVLLEVDACGGWSPPSKSARLDVLGAAGAAWLLAPPNRSCRPDVLPITPQTTLETPIWLRVAVVDGWTTGANACTNQQSTASQMPFRPDVAFVTLSMLLVNTSR